MTQLSETRKKDIFDNPSLRCALNAFAENVVAALSATDEESEDAQQDMGSYIATYVNDENVYMFISSTYFHIHINTLKNKAFICTDIGFWQRSIFIHFEKTISRLNKLNQKGE